MKEIEELESRCFRLETELETTEERLNQYEIEDLEERKKRIQDELKMTDGSLKYDKYDSHCAELETANIGLLINIQTLEANIINIRNHCNILTQNQNELKVENTHLRTQIEQLQKKIPILNYTIPQWI